MRAALQRLDAPQANPPTTLASASARLPADVEQALQTLERLDSARVGGAAKEVLKRLARIAKLVQGKAR